MRSLRAHRKATSIFARRCLSSSSQRQRSSITPPIISQETTSTRIDPILSHVDEQAVRISFRQRQCYRRFTSDATTLTAQHDMNTNTNTIFPSQSELISQTEDLIDLTMNPIGNFTTETMDESTRLLESWSRSQHSIVGAEQITKILYRIIQENKEGNPNAFFNSAMAETVCVYWREISIEQCTSKTLEIAGEMKSILEDDAIPYNNLIAILAKCRTKQAAVAVEGFLHRMIQLQKEGLIDKDTADVVTYNSAISTWMHIAREEREAGERAIAILNRMKGAYRIGDGGVKPNILSFSMAINTLLRCEGNAAALQAEDLIQDLIYFHCESWRDEDMVELKRIFDNVLDALNQLAANNPNAADRAVNLLRFMETARGLSPPDTKTYNTVIGALAKQRNKSCIGHIEGIIDDMNRNHASTKNDETKPNTATYNTLIKAYVKHGEEVSAESMLRQMEHEYKKGNNDVRPNSVTWNLVIEGHAKSLHERAAHNAALVMDRMVEYGKKHPDVQPDKVTVSSMLKSLVQKASKGNKIAGKQAVQILDKIIESYKNGNELMKPDKIIFSTVINCVAKCGRRDAGSEALVLLNRMQQMHKEGYTNLKPDTVTLNTTLSALANTQSGASAEKAEKLLQAMISSKDPELAPNVQSYTLVISAWAKSGTKEATKKVEKLLLDMEKIEEAKPNAVSYSTALNAFAKSTDPSSCERAMRVLQRMESGEIKVRPNAYCYASVMECISKSREKDSISADAMSLLRRMTDQNGAGRNDRDSYTVVFNTAIKAIERSSEERKDKVAIDFLHLMKEVNKTGQLNAPLNVRTYNAVIRACAFTKGDTREKRIAFTTAFDTLKELRATEALAPDLYTYPALFRAGEELQSHSDEDLDIFRSIFHMCCEDGLVDALLLKNLRNFLPTDFMRSLLRTEKAPESVRLNDLPRDWKLNIYNNKSNGRKSGKRKS